MSLRSVDISGMTPPPRRDHGAAPVLVWVPIAQMVIDEAYQRPIGTPGKRQIARIAAEFDWTKFGAVVAAPIEGGRYAIVDGQHRVHAAALAGIAEVPVLAAPMDRVVQARAFSAINGNVTQISALIVYRAALAAGEGWAEACRDAVEAGHCQLMTYNASAEKKQPGEIYSIAVIRRWVDGGMANVVSAGLSAIRHSAQGDAAWECYSGSVLEPWFRALSRSNLFLKLDLAGVLDERVDLIAELDNARARSRALGQSARDIMAGALEVHLRAAMEREAA